MNADPIAEKVRKMFESGTASPNGPNVSSPTDIDAVLVNLNAQLKRGLWKEIDAIELGDRLTEMLGPLLSRGGAGARLLVFDPPSDRPDGPRRACWGLGDDKLQQLVDGLLTVEELEWVERLLSTLPPDMPSQPLLGEFDKAEKEGKIRPVAGAATLMLAKIGRQLYDLGVKEASMIIRAELADYTRRLVRKTKNGGDA